MRMKKLAILTSKILSIVSLGFVSVACHWTMNQPEVPEELLHK
ncbi:cyclic lactone autoinducer peptide [Chengkuizengella sediminis]|nr:cyclic lactone autoinducer peptide [Chengkuizengella sediminis]NDI36774.1 cyclic lactone autoinducer peptide [Chengkuizengella sediminis]